ncbi:MAG: 5'-3' exonuclease [Pseudonocardiaceae bacterium]
MSRLSPQPPLPMPTLNGTGGQVPLLLVDGHNLLWGATFGFPAPIYSRDKTRLLTGLFAFFALLRVAIRDDVPGAAPEVIVVFDGEYGAVSRQQTHDGYKASRPIDDQALAPLQFLPDVKRGLDHCGIAWIELEYAEADDVIATVVHATTAPRPVIIMSRDRDYYQLITDRVVVLNTRFRAGRKLVTPHEVYARHQVMPAQWADYRALAGDPADEIPGVRGIGAKTAAALLDGGLTLDDLPCSGRLATGRARAVAEQFELALKWRDMIRLNTGLELSRWPAGHASPPLPRPADVVEQLCLW